MKMHEKSKNESTPISKFTDNGSDQPRVVELLRKPSDVVEMILLEKDKVDKYRRENMISAEDECLAFIPNKMMLCVNLSFRTHFSRAEFVAKLEKFSKYIQINEVCIVKNSENEEFIKGLCQEIQTLKDWTGPRVCILRGIKRIDDDNEKQFILNDFHLLPTSGHAGVRRMTNNIKRRYFWPGIYKDVLDFVKKCPTCQKTKYSRYTKQPMTITTTASTGFEKIFLDLVGPLDKDEDGNCYLLTIQCELTKFIEAYPIPNKAAVTVAKSFVQFLFYVLVYQK